MKRIRHLDTILKVQMEVLLGIEPPNILIFDFPGFRKLRVIFCFYNIPQPYLLCYITVMQIRVRHKGCVCECV